MIVDFAAIVNAKDIEKAEKTCTIDT